MDVVICYSPDRLARKLAYQTLLIDEFNKAGSEVRFVKARKVETPEDEMLLQFQGMMAEYERALIMERTRRGKAFRARAGVVNVLGGAPYGYRYIRRSDISEARYEIIEDEAQIVREMFRRYTEDQVLHRRAGPLAERPRESLPAPARTAGTARSSGRC